MTTATMTREDADAVARMARSIAAALARQNGGLPASVMDVLVADGMYGAVLAWESFKPDAGAAFTTWAFPYIKRYARLALNDAQGRTTRGDHRPEQSLDVMRDNEEDPFDVADDEPDWDAFEVRESVNRAVADLPDRERHCIRAVYWRGLTREQAGKELGIGKTMARRIVDRAHDELRATLVHLEDYVRPEPAAA